MDRRVSAAVNEEMVGSMIISTHMRMTPSRRATAADSARALALLDQMHRSLDKYRNVQVAESDGFTQFLPNVPQPVYHFTNLRWSIAEAFRFDPSHPSSLLYRKSSHGDFTLIGAMYTARRNAPTDDLDSRIPLGISRWHQHVNWCVPRKGDQDRWRETRDGSPLFGPQSRIATREECDRIDGVFHPNVFGWMVHVNAWEGDDPAVIWGHQH
ncbi:MAG: hypothetical protein ACR2OG_10635 [Gemmatimonadaceae bacterium]